MRGISLSDEKDILATRLVFRLTKLAALPIFRAKLSDPGDLVVIVAIDDQRLDDFGE